jgi:uncharacterized phage protein (TIGR01671 family)
MIREIKFKFWDIKGKEWLIDGRQETNIYDFVFEPDMNWTFVDGKEAKQRVVVLQFTGFKDRKGKEIFEGDVVKIFLGDGSDVVRHIVWYRDGWKTQLIPKSCGCCDKKPSTENYGRWAAMEIIGNIYENSF